MDRNAVHRRFGPVSATARRLAGAVVLAGAAAVVRDWCLRGGQAQGSRTAGVSFALAVLALKLAALVLVVRVVVARVNRRAPASRGDEPPGPCQQDRSR